jgi:hypothetical protein
VSVRENGVLCDVLTAVLRGVNGTCCQRQFAEDKKAAVVVLFLLTHLEGSVKGFMSSRTDW